MTLPDMDQMISDAEEHKDTVKRNGDDFYKRWTESRAVEEEFEARLVVLYALKEKDNEIEQKAYAEGLARGKGINLNDHGTKLSDIVKWFVEQDK